MTRLHLNKLINGKRGILVVAALMLVLTVILVTPAEAGIFTDLDQPPGCSGAIMTLLTYNNALNPSEDKIFGSTTGGQLFSYKPGDSEPLYQASLPSGEWISAMTVERTNGKLYCGTNLGNIYAYNAALDDFVPLNKPYSVPVSYRIHTLTTATSGEIYGIAGISEGSRMFKFNPVTEPISFVDCGNICSGPWFIGRIVEYDENRFFACGDNGLYCYDQATGMNYIGRPDTESDPYGIYFSNNLKIYGASPKIIIEQQESLYNVKLWTYQPGSDIFSTPFIVPNTRGGSNLPVSNVYGGLNCIYWGWGRWTGSGFQAIITSPEISIESPETIYWGSPVDGEQAVSAMTKSSDLIYGGTYPSGHFFVFNPTAETQTPTLAGTGEPVLVSIPTSGASITFDSIEESGVTSVVKTTETPPQGSPMNFEIVGNTYYEVETTAQHSGPITVTLKYDDTGLTLAQEQALVLKHWNGSGWNTCEPITVDTEQNTITGMTMSLSPFVIGYSSSGGGGSAPSPGISTGVNAYWLMAQAMAMLLAGLYMTRKRLI